MTRCAVFTVQKDETFHLPQWIAYYSQHFDPADMYVLDHDSTEAAVLEALTAFTGNVIPIHNDLVFDHNWLLQTVHGMQQELLSRYEYVLFTDADELVIPASGTLRDFIVHADQPAYRCRGYEILENGLFHSSMYDKTLLSSHPLQWANGYHTASQHYNPTDELILYHLHRMDFDEAWRKNQRWSERRWDPNAISGGLSVQNQITDFDLFKGWFYDTGGRTVEPIHHRALLELARFKPLRCSIIIPLFGPEHLLVACLKALRENTTGDYELVVVDNGTGYLLNDAVNLRTVIRNSTNLGFSAACNQGATASHSELLCFLNVDTEVGPGWLPNLLTAFVDPEVVMAGPRSVYPDGSLEGSGIRTWHGNGTAGGDVILEDLPTRDVDGVGGVCMMIRADTFHALGGFDPDFINGYEDVALCLYAREKGHRIRYVNESVIMHHGGATGPERSEHTWHNNNTMNVKWGRR